VSSVSRGLDRIRVTFDEPTLVANAGLVLIATLATRLGIEQLVNRPLRLNGRVGGALPGRKVLTLVHAICAGASHIDHANVLRAGATGSVLGHRVMAPSTLGTFLRAFTFGHVRQLEAAMAEVLRRAWAMGAGPGAKRLVVDVDSTICEVTGRQKQGASFGYTKVRGYHPLLATRAETGEVLHARMRKGSAHTARGMRRFIEELVPRLRRAGASGEIVLRCDSGFWSNDTMAVLARLGVCFTMAVHTANVAIAKVIGEITEDAWTRSTTPPTASPTSPRRPTRADASSSAERASSVRTSSCGPTGDTSGFSPISKAPRQSSTHFTVTTPASSLQSAT